MDSKITLVKTNNLSADEQKEKKTETRPSNKPFKARGGKHHGFHGRKYPPRNQEQKNESIPEQRQEHETEAVRSQPQEQGYDSYHDQNQAYQENGYGNNRYQSAAEYGEQQEYRFVCEFPRAKDYTDIATVAQTFPHLKDVNGSALDIDGLTDLRCFIMRSNNEDDIHKAIKYGIWTSTPKSNEFLNNIYEECVVKKVPIFLFYSVVRSGQFVAVAQMTSKIIEKSFQYWWEGDKWVNHFQVKWHFIKDVPYKYFSHLYMDDDLPVTRARDCTGVPLEVTKEMLRIYRDYDPYNSIFNAFPYMDVREDMLRSYKNSVQMYQRYYTAGESYNAGYTAQGANASSYQSGPQYFKYNSFPAKQKDANSSNSQNKSYSPKKDASNTLDNLYKEFEITFTFYNDEIKKWEKDGENLSTLVATEKKEDLASKHENLKSREKEILEGLEVLENKYKAVIQGSQEFEQKVTDQEAQRKQQTRVKDITNLLEKFKEGFNTSKRNMSSLYEKIEGLKK